MKPITVFQARDGRRFDSELDCRDHEVLCDKIEIAMRSLGRQPHLSDGEFYRHDQANCVAAKTAIVELCREKFPKESVFQHQPMMIHPHSYAGRFLDDCGGPLRDAWYRFQKINWATFREWDQPYYALQEERAVEAGRVVSP